MKKIDRDYFKKYRDKYPFNKRIILAIIIATIIGLTTANATNQIHAATIHRQDQTSQVRQTQKIKAKRFAVIDPDVLPSGNTLNKPTHHISLFVKVGGSLVALLAIGISLFGFKPKKQN